VVSDDQTSFVPVVSAVPPTSVMLANDRMSVGGASMPGPPVQVLVGEMAAHVAAHVVPGQMVRFSVVVAPVVALVQVQVHVCVPGW
jgi:hypothetical protein